MKKLLTIGLLMLLFSAPAVGQHTIPFTFAPDTTILASEVNSNFSTLASDSLNRTGGTLTGNVTVNASVTIDGADISTFLLSGGQVRSNTDGTVGAPAFSSSVDTTTGMYFPSASSIGWSLSGVNKMELGSGLSVHGNVLVDTSGRIPALTSTYFASLDGSALTGILETNVIDGSVLARVAANETISGAWTFDIGTVASDIKIARFLSTWNNAGVTFEGLQVDVTNTASAAGSKLIDAKVGGASVWSVGVDGKTTTTTFRMTAGASNNFVLTSDASGNASWAALPGGTTGVPTGMVAWFESACPGGWTSRSSGGATYENKFVRGGATYSAAGGGSDSHVHSIDPASTTSDSQGNHTHQVDVLSTGSDSQGSHGHTISGSSATTDVNHSHTFTTGGPNNTDSFDAGFGAAVATSSHTHGGTTAGAVENLAHSHGAGSYSADSAGAHSHTTDPVAVTSSSSGAHTHSTDIVAFDSGSNLNIPAYVQVVICKKD